MKSRFLTALGIVLVLAVAFILKFYVSNYFFDVLVLGIAVFSSFEMSKILSKMGKYNDKIMIVLFPIALMAAVLLGIASDSSIGLLITIAIEVCIIVVFFLITFIIPMITFKKTAAEIRTRKIEKTSVVDFSFKKALNTALIFIYPSFLITFLTFINHFEDMSTTFAGIGYNGIVSLVVLLFAFLIPIFTDTFAYLVGGIFGGKKLAPKISPKKTISGAVGGFLFCILLSIVVFSIFNAIPSIATIFENTGINLWKVALISAIGSILSQIGDLIESWFKRSAGVKDSGNILPGHGGMLDRFDSYMLVAPFVFAAFSIIFILI